MINEMNLDFIHKTNILPNIELIGFRINNRMSLNFNHYDRNYDCNCYYDCDYDCDCDCNCNDCYDDCIDHNPYGLDPWDYEAWRDSFDD